MRKLEDKQKAEGQNQPSAKKEAGRLPKSLII
jgi:hypothetical protein